MQETYEGGCHCGAGAISHPRRSRRASSAMQQISSVVEGEADQKTMLDHRLPRFRDLPTPVISRNCGADQISSGRVIPNGRSAQCCRCCLVSRIERLQ